jgi:hypothetical protein
MHTDEAEWITVNCERCGNDGGISFAQLMRQGVLIDLLQESGSKVSGKVEAHPMMTLTAHSVCAYLSTRRALPRSAPQRVAIGRALVRDAGVFCAMSCYPASMPSSELNSALKSSACTKASAQPA